MSPRPCSAPLRLSNRTALSVPLLALLLAAACGEGGSGADDAMGTVGAGDPSAPAGEPTGVEATASQALPGSPRAGGPGSSSSNDGDTGAGGSGSDGSGSGGAGDGASTGGATGSPVPTAAASPSGGTGSDGFDDGVPSDGASDDGSPTGATSSEGDADDAATGGDDPGTEASGGAGGNSSTSDDSGEGGAGSGDAPSDECTRELLDGLIDEYFAALAAGDPSTLPLATSAKFTENAEVTEIGTTEFWMNAGDVKHSQRALDTTACAAAVQAVVPEGTTDLPIGLRIKVEAGELTEIETIVVRQGDYTASYAVDNNPARIIEIASEIGWNDEVPDAERATREELSAWIDKYFRAFPGGVCNVSSSCIRLENGGGPDYSCGAGATCDQGAPGAGGTMIPRLIIVDEVRGIAAGLAIFDYFNADGHLDMHMMKMSGGQVHAVHALLRDTDGETGWD